jgi:hypothetical protein
MNLKNIAITTLLATSLISPLPVLASSILWNNPTEYYSLPNGTTDSNKTERLDKGNTYKISFDASTYGENVLLVYAQNKNYLNEFIPLSQEWQHFEFTIIPKTNTHVVFEDLQQLGDINIKNIRVELIK